MAPPHPLRRISTGSLSSLARSQDKSHTSPSGLDFLQPAMVELADEAATLAANIGQLNEMHDALGTFNESFAAWMYALKMNAFCVEWPQGPNEHTFQRAAQLEAEAALDQLRLTTDPDSPDPPSKATTITQKSSSPRHGRTSHIGDQTAATVFSVAEERKVPVRKSSVGGLKKPGQSTAAKRAAAEKKKRRDIEVSGYIEMLPLEFRGSQPTQRLNMEKVINKLMDKPAGSNMKDLISPPDLPQAKVNKCLIALVGKKLISKENIGGATWYKWVGI